MAKSLLNTKLPAIKAQKTSKYELRYRTFKSISGNKHKNKFNMNRNIPFEFCQDLISNSPLCFNALVCLSLHSINNGEQKVKISACI